MENNTFTYKYSAKRNAEVEKIRRKYMPHEESKLETLKRLDSQVKMAGTVEGLSLGIVGALVFGVGVCFFLGVFTGWAWLSPTLMTAGTLLMIPAFPVYRRLSRSKREKLTPEILRLSEEIIDSEAFQ